MTFQAHYIQHWLLLFCCSDIKGALSSLLRTFSDADVDSSTEGDKIAAVARDGADQRPVSATPSTLGGSAPGRKRTKDALPEAGVIVNEQGVEPHQPNAPRVVVERPHTHLRAAQES